MVWKELKTNLRELTDPFPERENDWHYNLRSYNFKSNCRFKSQLLRDRRTRERVGEESETETGFTR